MVVILATLAVIGLVLLVVLMLKMRQETYYYRDALGRAEVYIAELQDRCKRLREVAEK